MEKKLKTILITVEKNIAHIRLNNPGKANAFNRDFWTEIKQLMEELNDYAAARAILISGEGKHFSAGIDLSMFQEIQTLMAKPEDPGRAREQFRKWIIELQDAITAIEKCNKPVIAAIHGACLGAALDLASACDMRYCTKDTFFSIKEIDLAIVADVGVLQRLPGIIGEGFLRELAFTGRDVAGPEAKDIQLVNECYDSREKMMEDVQRIATAIAEKSPLTQRGLKEIMNYTRDHSIEDSLKYTAVWNSATLYSNDFMEAMQAGLQKRKPRFVD